MLSTRIFGLACGVAVFVCLMAAPVSAQPFDKRTMFTFSGPVTLPGITLPADSTVPVGRSQQQREGRAGVECRRHHPIRTVLHDSCRATRAGVVAGGAFHGNRVRDPCGHSDVVVPRRTQRSRVHFSQRASASAGDGSKSARADDRRPDDNNRTDEYSGTVASGLERAGD